MISLSHLNDFSQFQVSPLVLPPLTLFLSHIPNPNTHSVTTAHLATIVVANLGSSGNRLVFFSFGFSSGFFVRFGFDLILVWVDSVLFSINFGSILWWIING